MAGSQEGATRFRRQLLGYDRSAVQAALASTEEQLRRAEERRDELLATTANVERIGAQVADMLRSLADRAVELEVEAAATAAQTVQEAQQEADQIRAQAAALLASAEVRAAELVEAARQQQRTIAERRENALISLKISIDQMSRLATLVDEIDLTAVESPPSEPSEPSVVGAEAAAPAPPAGPDATEPVVLLPWSAAIAPPPEAPAPPAGPTVEPAEDPLAPAVARLGVWARTS